MPELTPIDYNPFEQPTFTPIDYNPFEEEEDVPDIKQKYDLFSRMGQHAQRAGEELLESRATPEESFTERALTEIGQPLYALGGMGGELIADVYDQLLWDPIQKKVTGAGIKALQALGDIPLPGTDADLGDKAKELAAYVEGKPRLRRALKNLVSVASVAAPIGRTVKGEDVVSLLKGAIEHPKDIIPKKGTPKHKMSEEFFAQAEDQYRTLAKSGELVPIKFTNDYDKLFKLHMPKVIKGHKSVTGEGKKLQKHLNELLPATRRQRTFDEIREIDRQLTEKISNETDNFGSVSSIGQKLIEVRAGYRKLIDEIPDRPETVNLNRAKIHYTAAKMLEELEEVAYRASLSQNEARALQTGYTRLLKNKNWGKNIPEVRRLLERAAKTGWGNDILAHLGSRLPSIITGSTMGPLAGTAVFAAGIGARSARGKLVAGRGGAVIEKIAAESRKKVEGVTSPKTTTPILQIPPKEKLSALPMSPEQVKISKAKMKSKEQSSASRLAAAQKRVKAGKPDETYLSGAAIKPTVTPEQLPMKLIEGPPKDFIANTKAVIRQQSDQELMEALANRGRLKKLGISTSDQKVIYKHNMKSKFEPVWESLESAEKKKINVQIERAWQEHRRDLKKIIGERLQDRKTLRKITGEKQTAIEGALSVAKPLRGQ